MILGMDNYNQFSRPGWSRTLTGLLSSVSGSVLGRLRRYGGPSLAVIISVAKAVKRWAASR